MKIGSWQAFVLSKSDEIVTLECQLHQQDAILLSHFILVGSTAIPVGLATLAGVIHLPNATRGIGIMFIVLGCAILVMSWNIARLASTVTFDLKQKRVTITPKWNFGFERTYLFDKIQSLHAEKHLGLRFPFIGTSRFQHNYWRFYLNLKNKKKIRLGEGYPPRQDDKCIRSYIETISSVTGLPSQIG